MALKLTKSMQVATLAAALDSTSLTFTVEAGQGDRFEALSGSEFVYALLSDPTDRIRTSRYEWVKLSARSTDTFSIASSGRGLFGTTARSFAAGARVAVVLGHANAMAFLADGGGAIIQAAMPTLTAYSARNLILTPTAAGNLDLPATDVWTGKEFMVFNLASTYSYAITVRAADASTIVVLYGGMSARIVASEDEPADNTGWYYLSPSLVTEPAGQTGTGAFWKMAGQIDTRDPAGGNYTMPGNTQGGEGAVLLSSAWGPAEYDTETGFVTITPPLHSEPLKLTHAWANVSGYSASGSLSLASQDATPIDGSFSPDGLKFYMLGFSNTRVYQYTLGTAWDLSTATYDSVSVSVGSQQTSPRAIYIKPDGLKMYVVGLTPRYIHQYTLSIPWDITTRSYDTVLLDISAVDTSPASLIFTPLGQYLFWNGLTNDTIYRYYQGSSVASPGPVAIRQIAIRTAPGAQKLATVIFPNKFGEQTGQPAGVDLVSVLETAVALYTDYELAWPLNPESGNLERTIVAAAP